MSTFPHISSKIKELLEKAEHIDGLAKNLQTDLSTRQEVLKEYQSWYRASLALLNQHSVSGVDEFEKAYGGSGNDIGYYLTCIGRQPYRTNYVTHFKRNFEIQVALLFSLPAVLETRRYIYLKELSADVSLSELNEAQVVFNSGFERAAGVIARVALEGFVKTLFKINIGTSPIPKFDQCIIELKKSKVIEERHRKHLTELYGLGSACAHPGSTITSSEIQRLVDEVRLVIKTLP